MLCVVNGCVDVLMSDVTLRYVTLRLRLLALLYRIFGPFCSFLLCLFELVIIACDAPTHVRTFQLTVNISSFLRPELME